MKGLLLLISILSIAFTSSIMGQSNADYKIYNNQTGQIISLQKLVDETSTAHVLFFGEQHNDSIGHALQAQIYDLLLKQHGQVALSLEMFETDCQYILDEYRAGHINEAKMKSDARAWNNYDSDYRPMVEQAIEQGQMVIAANAPRRYVNMVSRKGLASLEKLPKSSLKYLPKLPIYTEDEGYKKRFQEIMGGAGHSMPTNIYHAQCTWDAGMANSIYQYWKKNKDTFIYHLNGSFHTDYKQGTINQLLRLNKKIKVQNITCFPAEDYDQPNWKEYAERADFVIIHPAK